MEDSQNKRVKNKNLLLQYPKKHRIRVKGKSSSRTTRKTLLWSCTINQTYSIHRQLRLVRIRVQCFTADIVVNFADNNLESRLDIGRIECRCLHEEQPLFFCKTFALFCAHLSNILQVAFISHQHSCYGAVILSCRLIYPRIKFSVT